MKRFLAVASCLLVIVVMSGATFVKVQSAPLQNAPAASLPAPRLLKIINSDPESLTTLWDHSAMTSGNLAYFLVQTTYLHFNSEYCKLWASDGSTEGTYPIFEVAYDSNMAGCPTQPFDYLPFGQHSLMFNIYSYYGPKSFYITDGIVATELLDSPAFGLTPINGQVIFFTNTAHGLSKPGVWITDGTPGGTVEIKQIERILSTTFRIGQDVFFIVDNGTDTWLWKTDGTPEGTIAVKQILSSVGDASDAVVLNGKTYFLFTYPVQTASDYDYPVALWATDGSEAGTALIKDLPPIIGEPIYFRASSNLLFFVLVDHNANYILWQSDGTTAGTEAFDGNPIVPEVEYGFAYKDAFYISDHNGMVLNKTTGKIGGFSPILNGRAVTGNGYALANGRLYLGNGHLWVTDGGGLTELVGAQPYQYPVGLTGFGSRLFFTLMTGDSATGSELWSSDGSPSGTGLYADINPGPASSNIGICGQAAGRLYLMADDGVHGPQLWVLDDPLPVKTYLPAIMN